MVTDIEILLRKAKLNYYTSIQDVLVDVIFLFKYINANLKSYIPDIKNSIIRDLNFIWEYKSYLNNLYFLFVEKLNGISIQFSKLFQEDLEYIIENNLLPKKSILKQNSKFLLKFFLESENRVAPVKKKYEILEDYIHINVDTIEKVKTQLKPRCHESCCETYENLGPLNLGKSTWDSNCFCRKNNLECSQEYCGCDSEKCKNQDIWRKNDKKLNQDVEERYSWGIDLYTYRNFLEILPMNFSELYRSYEYIETKLIRSLPYLVIFSI